MPRGYQVKRRRTSRRGYRRGYGNKGRKAFKRYGDFKSDGVKGYLKSQGTIRVPTALGSFPRSVETTFTYCETVLITTTSGVNDYYVWSGNDLYNPNLTGSGHQPFGFDQWGAIFSRYTVYGSQCELEVLPTSTSSVGAYTYKICLVPFALGSGLSSLNEDYVAEMPMAKTKSMNVYTAGAPNKIISYASTAKVFGVPNAAIDVDDTYSGSISTPAVKVWAWWVKVNDLVSSGSTAYDVRIRIKYYAKLYRNQLDTSS